MQPIFTSEKIVDDLTVTELKFLLVNQFRCGLWDTKYIGYTRRYLPQRVKEHKHSVIGKHNLRPSNLRNSKYLTEKCRDKLECFIFQMLFIQK